LHQVRKASSDGRQQDEDKQTKKKKDDKCDAIISASFFRSPPAIIKLNGKGWMAQK
jgi:hypothetical protein